MELRISTLAALAFVVFAGVLTTKTRAANPDPANAPYGNRGIEITDASNCTSYTIKKEPISRTESGSFIIYKYDMSGAGCTNYKFIIVRSEQSKLFFMNFLRATSGLESLYVRTFDEAAQNTPVGDKAGRVARLMADLKDHSAVIESYENTASGAINR